MFRKKAKKAVSLIAKRHGVLAGAVAACAVNQDAVELDTLTPELVAMIYSIVDGGGKAEFTAADVAAAMGCTIKQAREHMGGDTVTLTVTK